MKWAKTRSLCCDIIYERFSLKDACKQPNIELFTLAHASDKNWTNKIHNSWVEKKAFPFFDLSSMQIKHFKDNCKMHLDEVNLKQPQNTTPAKTNKNAKAETM